MSISETRKTAKAFVNALVNVNQKFRHKTIDDIMPDPNINNVSYRYGMKYWL